MSTLKIWKNFTWKIYPFQIFPSLPFQTLCLHGNGPRRASGASFLYLTTNTTIYIFTVTKESAKPHTITYSQFQQSPNPKHPPLSLTCLRFEKIHLSWWCGQLNGWHDTSPLFLFVTLLYPLVTPVHVLHYVWKIALHLGTYACMYLCMYYSTINIHFTIALDSNFYY